VTGALTITPEALHALLTDAHTAIVEHRIDFAGTILHTLRVLTAPAPIAPQGRAMRLAPIAAATAEAPRSTTLTTPEAPPPAPAQPEPPPAPEPTPEPPAPTPPQPPQHRAIARQPSGGHRPVSTWSEARVAMLRAEAPTCTDLDALRDRLNALEGPEIASTNAVRTQMTKLGVRRTDETLLAMARASGKAGGDASVKAAPTAPSEHRTPERMELLRTAWMDPAQTVPMIFAAINAKPGPKLSASQALYRWARDLGLLTQRPIPEEPVAQAPAAPPPPPPPPPVVAPPPPAPPPPVPPRRAEPATEEPSPEEQARIADAAVESRQARVRASLREALAEHKGQPSIMVLTAIGSRTGTPLREVMRLMGEVRTEAAQQGTRA
jgi:hypothetical protein